VQIPWALSATAIIYNLDGAKNLLHMNGATLARIFAGQITQWDDPAIRALNKGVNLPSTKIGIVHRSDNSGTTYNLTDYLSSASGTWKSQYGKGVAVNWPTGSGQRGSAGVAAGVSQTPGGVGYVDVAYALKNHLKFFAMQNKSGKFATPGLKGILAAAASDVKPDSQTNELSIVNPPKKFALAYPVSTYTYVIVPTSSPKATDLRKFLFWAVTKGQSYGPKLLFQPIPKSVLVVAEKTIAHIKS
jgi:phosphate transport system substrate-binding protein